MVKMVKAKCPWCGQEFERNKHQMDNQVNPPRWISCSKSCNFSLLLHIKYHGISDELQKKINECVTEIYERPRKQRAKRLIYYHGKYAQIRVPDHPKADPHTGLIKVHRLIMELQLGRFLVDDEVVHHINENPFDNRIENLQLMSHAEHTALHHKLRLEKKTGVSVKPN